MLNGIRIAFVVLALAMPMAPALAELPPDYVVGELKKGDVEIMRAARPFADCLVAQKAKEIPKYLGSGDPGVERLARDMSKAHPECRAPKKLGKYVTTFLQTALLEALIQRDFGDTQPPKNFNHLPRFLYVRDTDNELVKEMYVNLIDPYDCVSRREPVKVRAFLATQPSSAGEAAAFESLKTTLVACQPKGETWELRPHFVRRFVAETYYALMKVDQRRNASTH